MITVGSILMEGNALHPQCFQLTDCSHPRGWMSVTHQLTHRELDKELSDTGWTFFFMASPLRATAFGSSRDKMLDTALKHIIGDVRQQGCNCVEIENVTEDKFLGIPRLSVSARPRHIQKGMVFAAQRYESLA
jgi:hypothetical protein